MKTTLQIKLYFASNNNSVSEDNVSDSNVAVTAVTSQLSPTHFIDKKKINLSNLMMIQWRRSTLYNFLQLNYAWIFYCIHPQPFWLMGNNTKQIWQRRQCDILLFPFNFTTTAVAFLGTQSGKYFVSTTLYGTHTLLSINLGSYKANSDHKLIRRKARFSHTCQKQPLYSQYK